MLLQPGYVKHLSKHSLAVEYPVRNTAMLLLSIYNPVLDILQTAIGRSKCTCAFTHIILSITGTMNNIHTFTRTHIDGCPSKPLKSLSPEIPCFILLLDRCHYSA